MDQTMLLAVIGLVIIVGIGHAMMIVTINRKRKETYKSQMENDHADTC